MVYYNIERYRNFMQNILNNIIKTKLGSYYFN